MSNNFDKVVKLACKPKNAPPKAKYVDSLIAATFSDDGSINDITRSLSLRLREPNAVVVFKGLLTLHQMIRSGSTDSLMEHLSQGDVLRLRNISGQSWEGYSPPSNLGAYSNYLDSRIKAFRELKHDLVRVQAESNRRSDGLGAGSKSRRLRHLPVEKGLLREVKQVQRVIETLIQCKFYDDDLRDENTVLAFRMLVKDLLVIFQAGNEGVCNILEHYFEMSKSDATEAFEVYKSFIKQTDRVVDYLAIARKLHNVVNVPVPNLKHAPTSLVKALEEYLNDPNFERNRIEYKNSLGVVEGKGGSSARTPSPNPAAAVSSTSAASIPAASPTPAPSAPAGAPQKIQDFFDSIQADQQPTMFGGQQNNGFSPQMQQPQFNPFRQSMMMPQQTGFMQPQMTGFVPQMPQMMQQPQMTGFMQPQQTGAMAFGQHSPFGQPQMQPTQPFMQPQQQQIRPQQTGFLQSQNTGSNPFRQSMMMPLNIGMAGPSGALSQPSSPFGQRLNGIPEMGSTGGQQINRPGSTPAFSPSAEPKPLTAQATGSKNPFAPASGSAPPVPPVPKGPTMNQMAMGAQNNQGPSGFPAVFQPNQQSNSANGSSQFGSMGGKPNNQSTGISDIASSFTFDAKSSGQSGGNDFLSQFGSMGLNGSSTGTTNGPSTGATSPAVSSASTGITSLQSQSTGFLQPQQTGYGGSTVKPFKPSSTFGSTLMENLPPIAGSPGVGSPQSPNSGSVQPQQTGFPAFNPSTTGNAFSGANQSNFGGQQQQQQQQQPAFGGLQPQTTGQPNPFRQSMFAQPTGAGAFGNQQFGTQPFGNQPFGSQPFGSQPFGNAQQFGQQQSQNQTQSLI